MKVAVGQAIVDDVVSFRRAAVTFPPLMTNGYGSQRDPYDLSNSGPRYKLRVRSAFCTTIRSARTPSGNGECGQTAHATATAITPRTVMAPCRRVMGAYQRSYLTPPRSRRSARCSRRLSPAHNDEQHDRNEYGNQHVPHRPKARWFGRRRRGLDVAWLWGGGRGGCLRCAGGRRHLRWCGRPPWRRRAPVALPFP